MSVGETSRLGELIVVWLWSQKGSGTEAALTKALVAQLELWATKAEVEARTADALAALEKAALVQRAEGRAPKLALTDAGSTRALEVQGLRRAPKKVDFAGAKARWLALGALGVPQDRLPKSKGFQAGLLRARLGLAVKPGASLKAVRDALAWRELGVETDQPFTIEAVTAHLFTRKLGATRALSSERALALFAAQSVGARNADVRALPQAALARLLDEDSTRPPDAEAAEPPRVPTDDDEAFAARIVAAARACDGGKYDPHHVFIARLWDDLAARGEARDLDFDGFKARLVRANQKRLLTLSRADFVEAMNPDDVRRSEIQYHHATFHFVRL